jgi:hypothetical protein
MRKAYAHWTLPSSAAACLALAVIIILRDQGELTVTFLGWMLIPVYACHQVEEHAWPGGFKQYVNAHAFHVTDRDFPLDDAAVFWINVPLTWVLFPLGAALTTDAPWLAAGCFTVPIINGVLHAIFSVRFRGWNPGVVTGVLLLIPVGIAGYAGLPSLPTGDAIGAWAVGIVLHVALVAFGVIRLKRAGTGSAQPSPGTIIP